MKNHRNIKNLNIFGVYIIANAAFLVILAGCGGGGGKKVYFGNLEDGAQLESPFKVQMKAENLIVEPATLGVNEGHGHFHIILDATLASPAEPMPKDEVHIHYGNGQSEAILNLPVGPHTLILQFAKGDHVPYDPPIYQQVQITVTKQNKVDTTTVAPVDSLATTQATIDSGKVAKIDTTKTTSTDTSKKHLPQQSNKNLR